MAVSSRDSLIDYCRRRLGEPVIELNVDEDQVNDRVDEALQYFQTYHSDATIRTYITHQITAQDVDNKYIDVGDDVLYIPRMFPISAGQMSKGMFDIRYQMHMNDIANMRSYLGDLAYYEGLQQYLSMLDMKLNGSTMVDFSRRQGRLYIHGEWDDSEIKENDYIIYEAMQVINSSTFNVWDDQWLKEYATALIQLQWGQNLIKFEGMQLPGGVMLNGRQMVEDAKQEIDRLREEIRSNWEFPVDMMVG